MKELKDEELKESKLLLEAEIKNLQKFLDPAKKIIEELELKEKLEDEDKKLIPLSEEDKKKLEDSKSEVLLLEKEIKERKDKINDLDEEVKRREELLLQIDNALKDFEIDEDVVESGILHRFDYCDCIEIKDEEDEVVDVKHIPWDKDAILKDLKLKLDLDKANDLVRSVKAYKHHKKKHELELKLKFLIQNNAYFHEVFGVKTKDVKVDGVWEKHVVHQFDRVSEWDKDDLVDFEEKVKALEEAKVKVDKKDKKDKKLFERQYAYQKVDGLLLEALVEKLEEGRPEKMEEYLKLRKEIKDKHPLEE
jgi:hypothetical protein